MGNMPSPVDCAYAAGFFDGEGCVIIDSHKQKGRSTYRLTAVVSQDDPSPLYRLRDTWGGSIRPQKPRPGGRVSYQWRLSTRQAARFLQDIQQFALVKAAAIGIALEFSSRVAATESRGRGGLPVEEQAARAELQRDLKVFNSGTHLIPIGGQ